MFHTRRFLTFQLKGINYAKYPPVCIILKKSLIPYIDSLKNPINQKITP